MLGLDAFKENWITIVAVVLVSIYPLIFKGNIEVGKLKPRKLLAVFGVLCAGFALLLIYGYFTGRFEDGEGIWWLVGLEVFLWAGAVYLIGEGHLVKGFFDAENIEFYTPWSGTKKKSWNCLVKVSHHVYNAYYALHFDDGTLIRVSDTLVGIEELKEHITTLGIDFD